MAGDGCDLPNWGGLPLDATSDVKKRKVLKQVSCCPYEHTQPYQLSYQDHEYWFTYKIYFYYTYSIMHIYIYIYMSLT